jgi:hypothetical protein
VNSEQLRDNLQYDFLHVWRERVESLVGAPPEALWRALTESLGKDFGVALVYPIAERRSRTPPTRPCFTRPYRRGMRATQSRSARTKSRS